MSLYSKQLTILQKITKSQSEDERLLIEQIAETQNDTANLQSQLDLCYSLEKMQQELIDYYKKKDRCSYIYGNIVTPIPGLLIMTYGFIEMGKGNTNIGWNCFKAGAITLCAMEVVYQGGHWAIKIW